MRVLIACEFSGLVRDAFLAEGYDAISCDLLESERPGPHIQADVMSVIGQGWDMMIGFPPCTAVCASGNRWYAGTPERAAAVEFFRSMAEAPIPRIALENPAIGALSPGYRRPDLVIQPWEYGAAETKATGLWLKNLPPLLVGDWVSGPYRARVHNESSGSDRWKRRSRTIPGLAKEMARQWGPLAGQQTA